MPSLWYVHREISLTKLELGLDPMSADESKLEALNLESIHKSYNTATSLETFCRYGLTKGARVWDTTRARARVFEKRILAADGKRKKQHWWHEVDVVPYSPGRKLC